MGLLHPMSYIYIYIYLYIYIYIYIYIYTLQEIHSLSTKITDGLNSVGNYRRNIDGIKHIIFSTFLL